jgi:hypothetical protein
MAVALSFAGEYALELTAPGFQTATFAATWTVFTPPPETCGCVYGVLEPSALALEPS